MSDGATEMEKDARIARDSFGTSQTATGTVFPPNPPVRQGIKHDSGKPRLDLIPVSAQLAEAHVLAFGAQKYGDNNWRAGMKWSRLYAAALRHLLAWADGETIDPESGLPHLAHARCNLGFLLEYSNTHPEYDDVRNPKE